MTRADLPEEQIIRELLAIVGVTGVVHEVSASTLPPSSQMRDYIEAELDKIRSAAHRLLTVLEQGGLRDASWTN